MVEPEPPFFSAGRESAFSTVSKSTTGRQSLGRQETITRARSRKPFRSFESRLSARPSFPPVSFNSSNASRKNQAVSWPFAFHRLKFSSSVGERVSTMPSRPKSSNDTKNANRPSSIKRFACSSISLVFPLPASARRTTLLDSNNLDQPKLGPNSYSLNETRRSVSSSSASFGRS